MLLESFVPLPGVHCESGTLRMMLAHAGLPQSEAMVFGLGQGLDFVIWPASDAEPPRLSRRDLPILSGRVDSCLVARRYAEATGIDLVVQETDSPETALAQARDILEAGHVAGLKLDIFHLPYFSSKRHFCAHFVALYGMDGQTAWLVDTEQQGGCHQIPLAALAEARASRQGQQASRNLSMHVAGSGGARPLGEAVKTALRGCAETYLNPPDAARGWLGLRNLVQAMPQWWDAFDAPAATLMGIANFWEFAGTGGANFRRLYGQFLREAQAALGPGAIDEAAALAPEVEQGWSACIAGLREAAQSGRPDLLAETARAFSETAGRELDMMRRLRDFAAA